MCGFCAGFIVCGIVGPVIVGCAPGEEYNPQLQSCQPCSETGPNGACVCDTEICPVIPTTPTPTTAAPTTEPTMEPTLQLTTPAPTKKKPRKKKSQSKDCKKCKCASGDRRRLITDGLLSEM